MEDNLEMIWKRIRRKHGTKGEREDEEGEGRWLRVKTNGLRENFSLKETQRKRNEKLLISPCISNYLFTLILWENFYQIFCEIGVFPSYFNLKEKYKGSPLKGYIWIQRWLKNARFERKIENSKLTMQHLTHFKTLILTYTLSYSGTGELGIKIHPCWAYLVGFVISFALYLGLSFSFF